MRTIDYTPRHKWDDRLGLPHGSVERVVHGSESWRQAQVGQMELQGYWSDVAAQLKLVPAEIEQLAHDFYSGDQLDSLLVGYIRQLKERGHQIALLSNDSPALLGKLQKLEIDGLFDPLIVSAFIGVMKPDARAYQITLRELGCPPERAVFVDDMPANIAGAAALGIHAIRFTTLDNLESTLENLLEM